MKIFLFCHLMLIGIACGIGCYARASASDVGVLSVESISEAQQLDCTIFPVSPEVTACDFSVEGMIETLNTRNPMMDDLGWSREAYAIRVQDKVTPLRSALLYQAEVTAVFQGDAAEVGDKIPIYALDGFLAESKMDYAKRRRSSLGSIPEDEIPPQQFLYPSVMNLMQPGDTYLAIVITIDVDGTNYFAVDSFSYFNMTNDTSRVVDATQPLRFCDYADNEVFACSQSYIDSYVEKKHALIDYFQALQPS